MKNMLVNKFILLAITCSIIQQAIVGCTTLFITEIAKSSISLTDLWIWVVLFVTCLFAVYIPSSFGLFFIEKSKFVILEKYSHAYTDSLYGKSVFRSSVILKNKRFAFLTNEAYITINEFCDFLWHFVGCFLNIIFNVFAFCFAIDKKMLLMYVLSLFLSFVVTIVFKKIISKQSKAVQGDRVEVANLLQTSWDNIIIGNIYNYKIWEKKLKEHIKKLSSTSSFLISSIEIVSGLGSVLSMVPIFVINYVFIRQCIDDGNNVRMVVLMATFPRQIQSMQNISTLVQMFLHWTSIYTKLNGLKDSSLPIDSGDLTNYQGSIEWEKIKFKIDNTEFSAKSVDEFMGYLPGKGRVTLYGENGSGKTTVFLKVKEFLKDDSFYFPCYSDLVFKKTFNSSLSTGEKIIASLDEVIKKVNFKVLLIDEWDANLDYVNKMKISEKIDFIAKNKTVVEIRHFK